MQGHAEFVNGKKVVFSSRAYTQIAQEHLKEVAKAAAQSISGTKAPCPQEFLERKDYGYYVDRFREGIAVSGRHRLVFRFVCIELQESEVSKWPILVWDRKPPEGWQKPQD